MKKYLKDSFAEFDKEYGISPTRKIRKKIRDGREQDNQKIKEVRSELIKRLIRLDFTPVDLDRIFKSLEWYCDRSYLQDTKKSAKELTDKIKALKAVLRSMKHLIKLPLEGSDRTYYLEAIARTNTVLHIYEPYFEKIYGKPADRKNAKSFKKGRKKNLNQDKNVFHMVRFFENKLKSNLIKPEKGDSARNLTLLLLQSAGFDEMSEKGMVSAKIIKDGYRRGELQVKMHASRLN